MKNDFFSLALAATAYGGAVGAVTFALMPELFPAEVGLFFVGGRGRSEKVNITKIQF